jgi:dipeptidyl aminopeptidase/acylaminoacyl peptidase
MHALKPVRRFAVPLKRLARNLCAIAALSAVLVAGGQGAAAAARGPTVKEVVEFTRIVYPEAGDTEQLQAQVSPDGTHAFIVTRRADTRTDRNRYEILLFDLRPDTLTGGKAGSPVSIATLAPVLDNNSAYPAVQNVQWTGSRTIVFRARLDDRLFQVFQIDTFRRRLTQLTFSPTDVVSFAVSSDLRRVVYAAQHDNPPLRPGQRSVVVGNKSFWSVKFGQQDMRAQLRRYQHFVTDSGSRRPARKLRTDFAEAGTMSPPVSISPDGRWALLSRYEPNRQAEWSQRYPLVADATSRIGPGITIDPLGYFARPTRYVPRQLVAHRLSDGTERLVVDAPNDDTGKSRPDLLWQGVSRSVIVAGTHLPFDAGAAGRGTASHVIEYWPDTGRWTVVAELKGRLTSLRPLPLSPGDFVVTDASGPRTFQRQPDGSWVERPNTDGEAADRGALFAAAGWSLKLKDSLDVPPDLFALGPAGQHLQLTRLNPTFSNAWGTIRPYAWKDAKGRAWNGGLMTSIDHDANARHALVIQTYGFNPNRFYLDGANTSIGFTSGFAGRAFLRENILVLALPVRASTNAPTTEAGGIAAFIDGVRGAIDALVADGLVDKDRIGIMGWSMTGERVLNQVTFSDAPIRAATILDGDANTLFSMTVTYGVSDGIQARKAKTNEGLPFGDTLATWIRNDPALHTDCVRAALRIETYGPWVLNNWDVYALLRRQYKPAEMVVIPGGTHGLMTPSERMISLQGNVDWFRFWLKGEERVEPFLWAESDETLKDQYRRWHEMAELKRADDARPACVPRGG